VLKSILAGLEADDVKLLLSEAAETVLDRKLVQAVLAAQMIAAVISRARRMATLFSPDRLMATELQPSAVRLQLMAFANQPAAFFC
jgi:hypothetical protein